jgi:hypothetical protein
MVHIAEQPFENTKILPEAPHSLPGILDPEAALEAARRMQRWYRWNPQGWAHSLFGRDGRRVEGRIEVELAGDGPLQG